MGNSSEVRSFLDPRTKMLLVLTIATICVAGGSDLPTTIAKIMLSLVPFILYLNERKYKTAFLYLIFYVISGVGGTIFIKTTYGVLNFIFVALFMCISRFMPGLAMGTYLVSSTKISEFMAAMDRMHIPQSVSIALSVTFRFFPTLKEEYQSISKSMRVRGVRFGGGKPFQMLEYRLIPLIISSMKISEELSAAALTRGLGSPKKRTNICNIGFRVQDLLAIGLCMFSWVMILYSGFII